MRFSEQLPLATLIELCRVLRHSLGAGLMLRDVFRQQADKGPALLRPIAGRIHRSLEQGDSLEDTLQREAAFFPPLFLSLAGVGEQSGMLPEIFGELEKYYQRQLKLRRQFRAQITWPAFELVAAILVIAFLIFALGFIAQVQHVKPIAPIGLGLTGTSGALIFLFVAFGSVAGLIALYLWASRNLRHKARVDALLLRVPAVGPCLRALALTRLCLALRLTADAGLAIATAARLGLRATGNAAFEETTPRVVSALKAGEDLTTALTATELFPEDFRQVMVVAEETGQLPEVMRRQAEQYDEEAGRRLSALTIVAAWGVWVIVAALIIVAIFRIWGTIYSVY